MFVHRRLARSWLPLALLIGPTPGCVTAMVWRSQGSADQVVEREHVATAEVSLAPDPVVEGALLVGARRTSASRPPALSGLHRSRSSWRLRGGEGAGEALAMLRGATGFEVGAVQIELERRSANGCVVTSRAVLTLVERIRGGGEVRPVTVKDLPAATLAALADARGPGVQASPLLAAASPEVREASDQLLATDPAVWTPRGMFRSPKLLGLVWSDRELCVLGDGDDAASGSRRPLVELRAIALVGEAEERPGAIRPTFFALPADRVGRWHSMSLDARGRRVHRSSWHAEPDASGAAEPGVLATGTMKLTYFEAHHEPPSGAPTAVKVLLTPFAAVVDTVLAASVIGIPLSCMAYGGGGWNYSSAD